MAALGQNEGKAPVTTAKALEKEFLPRHVAIIMDGNGRWAQKRGMPRTFGHKAGVEALREIIKYADELGVEPDFALGKFDRERPVEFAVDLERHEFVVDRHPVVFANQVCQLPDPDFVAVEPQQLGNIFGDMQFAGLEIRFPPTHVGGVQHEHQGLEIRGVGCEHGAMGCLGIFRAGG